MNIYYRKQLWKFILAAIAAVIVAVSLWYTNKLVNKISEEERKQVDLWVDAIHRKAVLVNKSASLFEQMQLEERKKVELLAKVWELIAKSDDSDLLNLSHEIIRNNTTVPVILTNDKGEIVTSRNLDPEKEKDPAYLREQKEMMEALYPPIEIRYYKNYKNYLYYKDSRIFEEIKVTMENIIESFISETVINSASIPVIYSDSTGSKIINYGNVSQRVMDDDAMRTDLIREMADQNEPIRIDLGEEGVFYVYYMDSFLLTQLKYYPYVQLGVIGIFIAIGYLLFSVSRRAEQNQVWVGMSKETAHQLGTPISSLMAWKELLKNEAIDSQVVEEIEKDLNRLTTVADRFSKIGSEPDLQQVDVKDFLEKTLSYLRTRLSGKVHIQFQCESKEPVAKLSPPLFSWVIENVTKNAVDAMDGKGDIQVLIADLGTNKITIDITDTGKGIPKAKIKTVFKPGYTTKKRGWGLGLSLTKRIIENYHNGRIFVKNSEVDKGTTFRIILNK